MFLIVVNINYCSKLVFKVAKSAHTVQTYKLMGKKSTFYPQNNFLLKIRD